MSNILVSDVQKQSPSSELIELFELELGNGSTIYLHSGLTKNLTEVKFRDRYTPSTVNTYLAMPIEMSGAETNAEGAQNRPILTIANVGTVFKDLLGGFTNEDLVGKKIRKRQTLRKYLYGEEEDTNPPFEFPMQSYRIDRMSGESPLAVEFELASPFDLEGIQLPNRVVVGKYCSWIYQGASQGKGGCTWPSSAVMYYPNAAGTLLAHKVYFTSEDEPIVTIAAISGSYSPSTTYTKDIYVSDLGSYWQSKQDGNLGNTPGVGNVWWQRVRVGTVWSDAGISYGKESYVEYGSAAWRAKTSHISTNGNAPFLGSKLWERADVCGKQMSSCKARFQFKPVNPEAAGGSPSIDKDTSVVLPFGAFPGATKFR